MSSTSYLKILSVGYGHSRAFTLDIAFAGQDAWVSAQLRYACFYYQAGSFTPTADYFEYKGEGQALNCKLYFVPRASDTQDGMAKGYDVYISPNRYAFISVNLTTAAPYGNTDVILANEDVSSLPSGAIEIPFVANT